MGNGEEEGGKRINHGGPTTTEVSSGGKEKIMGCKKNSERGA